MRKAILKFVKATFPLVAVLSTLIPTASAQQYIVADKDKTRPEQSYADFKPARITSFTATHGTGYNDIQWQAIAEDQSQKFIVEYSTDGIQYQTAGEVGLSKPVYTFRHTINDTRPLLYRLRMEAVNGKFANSAAILLDGNPASPVTIFPTVVTGDMINANASFPVERVNVTSTNGAQVVAKDFSGASGYLRIGVPSLQEGMYFITFSGNGWQTTSKFFVDK